MSHPKQNAVVLHVVEAAHDISRAVSTAGSLRKSFPGIRVQIIVNGPALEGLVDLDMNAMPKGTAVSACAVGLHRRSIDEAELPEGIEVVPAGPEAIVREQLEGAAYVRM